MAIPKKILLVVLTLFMLLVGTAFFLPSRVLVERTVDIGASSTTLFTILNGFRMFNKWSPWSELTPEVRYVYSGPEFGVGAKMSWKSNDPNLVSGSQEIIESKSAEFVRSTLNFEDQRTSTTFFKLVGQETQTKVTWGFEMELGVHPVDRYLGLMMDSMLGDEYAKGLAALKQLAEDLPKTDFSDLEPEITEVKAKPIAYFSTASSQDRQAIEHAMRKGYTQISAFMKSRQLLQAGAVLAIAIQRDDRAYVFDLAIPLDQAPHENIPVKSPVKIRQSYAGKIVKAIHRGSHHKLRVTYDKVLAFAAAYGFDRNGYPWEEYLSDLGDTPESDLITIINLPVK